MEDFGITDNLRCHQELLAEVLTLQVSREGSREESYLPASVSKALVFKETLNGENFHLVLQNKVLALQVI